MSSTRRFARTAFTAAFLFLLVAPGRAANLLSNPGFESGALTPWVQVMPVPSGDPNDWTVTSSDAHSGTFSVIDQDNRSLAQTFPAVPVADIVEVSFWVKHPDEMNAPLAVDLFYSDNDENEVAINTTTLDWEFHDVTAHLKPGKQLVGITVFGYSTAAPNHTLYDDLTVATASCPATPAGGCLGTDPGKGAVSIKDAASDDKDKLSWKWVGATTQADLGDPIGTDAYHLCIYQNGALASALTAPAGGTCAGKPCWKATPTGFAYRDKDATPNGLTKLRLKPAGKKAGKITVSGKGADLPLVAGPLATPVEVQLSRDGGPCWSGVFSAPKKNDASGFKAKSDL